MFIKTVPTDNELKFYYTVHTSLDVVEEKISSVVKFVIVVESSNQMLRDNEIRSMFRRLHNAYVDMLCNPFYTPGENIES
ncbi:hypothetical protein KUTeg_019649, partial [Tegillarca granosa]